MLINHDFTRRVTVTRDRYRWIPSPQPGVDRVMLDRIGAEQARATSLVRYLPDSAFPSHCHPGGEEILVLAGQFSEGGSIIPSVGICATHPDLPISLIAPGGHYCLLSSGKWRRARNCRCASIPATRQTG